MIAALSLLAGVLLGLTAAAPATTGMLLSSALMVAAAMLCRLRRRRWALAAAGFRGSDQTSENDQ